MFKSSLNLKSYFSKLKNYRATRKYDDSENSLVYIHIGKCGGESLWEAIKSSTQLNTKFNRIVKTHIAKPPILKKAKYLIVVRNPIKRSLSAFNWRYKLVVNDADPIQRERFEGEYEILKKYKTLNALAERLYTADGSLDVGVANEFRTIHHLKEDISFYLTELLEQISPKQVYAVFFTETLDHDMTSFLGISSPKRVHENSSVTSNENKFLSEKALLNLRKFLVEDYAVLDKLLKQIYTKREDIDVLFK